MLSSLPQVHLIAKSQSSQPSFVADDDLFQALEALSRKVPCEVGRTLFNQGDGPSGLYVIRSGEAAVLLLSRADNIVATYRAEAGSVLGLPAVIGNEPYTLCAIARKGSDIGFVRQIDFLDLLRQEPEHYPAVVQILAAEIRVARKALSAI
jgi:CRP-like cAMP-binding protein